MNTDPILFIDSGIGGLPYCRHFRSRNPAESLVYTADRANFPYGPKDRNVLIELLTELTGRLVDCFAPKLIVLACNTAAVSALEPLRKRFPDIPFVGTVPAVKPAVLQSRTRSVGVLGTNRTIEDPYIAELARQYGPGCRVTGIAAPDLVEFVEHSYAGADPEQRKQAVRPYIEEFARAEVDGIVLGCTHFLFLADEFRASAEPGMTVYDSVEGVSRRAETLLAESNRAAPQDHVPRNILLVTGPQPLEPAWSGWASSFGLELCGMEACYPEKPVQ
ncbi:glutamate racemase [Breznakiella homolactica]|uniref:Glutamate racemase n=2 Tax=Breznakiella homolactica TaxID=2798577 RepID=A0A7T7XS01_9SPIR|nr:glutamate racemase [Breznakiella homolactica]